MSQTTIEALGELASQAQQRIQKESKNIEPVVGLIKSMREAGFPADVLTIDCIKSNKRIMVLLHDDRPTEAAYEFGFRDKDPTMQFSYISYDELTAEVIYQWMKEYFLTQ